MKDLRKRDFMSGKGYYQRNSTEYRAAYQRAVRRVQARLGFQQHLMAYLIGNTLLVLIYLLTRTLPGFPEYPWFIWPMAGWGLALLIHFLEVFIFSVNRAEETRRRMIERELRQEVEAHTPRY